MGTKSRCSSRPPPGHHVPLAQRWKEIKSNTFWTLDSDCMTGPTCNGRHDLIRTPFGKFFIWLERKFDRASNSTSVMSKYYLSRRESSKQVDVQNLSRCCVTVFWVVGPCIVSGPMGARHRIGARPPPGPGHAPTLSYTPIAATNRWGFVLL